MKNLEPDRTIAKVFVDGLLKWNLESNHRKMPWKGEKDPYKIWLSEIILQQTRVEQGLKYYENFIKSFPTVHALANAPQEKVFKHWEGLGYYSRCRNLIETALYISNELKGIFPSTYDSILKLKGVGGYTAAAIASFAGNLPYAVVDGNVFRVLSRIFDIETAIDTTEGKKEFSRIAQTILPETKAGEYNQAIMDFGAVICKPVPECRACFFNNHCKAYTEGKQQLLPVKEKKISIKHRWLNYIVIRYKNQVAIHQRTGKDIWQQLFEFVLIETAKKSPQKQLLKQFERQYSIDNYVLTNSFEQTMQKLSHQLLSFHFIILDIPRKEKIENYSWVSISRLHQFAFPKTLKQFIDETLL
jgi:A/G-specific adenine glycosylase